MWRELLAWLAFWSADPAMLAQEQPKAAACVCVARASMEVQKDEPKPRPRPRKECCDECKGTGKIRQPDGHVTDCPCPDDCKCKKAGDPPLVPIKPDPNVRRSGRIICENGTCYWVDEVTGERFRVVK